MTLLIEGYDIPIEPIEVSPEDAWDENEDLQDKEDQTLESV